MFKSLHNRGIGWAISDFLQDVPKPAHRLLVGTGLANKYSNYHFYLA